MAQPRFLSRRGAEVTGAEWLSEWMILFPTSKYPGYEDLLAKHASLMAEDYEQIGRWKDFAWTDRKWRPNVASVAFVAWKQAGVELPATNIQTIDFSMFLNDWSSRKYDGQHKLSSIRKTFGLSRATTLSHFMSGGSFPIFDARVRRAVARLTCSRMPYTLPCYLDVYVPVFHEIAEACGTTNLRAIDKALFSYRGRRKSVTQI